MRKCEDFRCDPRTKGCAKVCGTLYKRVCIESNAEMLHYINDLPNIFVHCKPLLFADDCKLIMKIRSIDDIDNFQSDIQRLHNWCLQNRLEISVR